MISNNFRNSLKFSKNEYIKSSNGILNQNPIIITKSEAFNFNYTDTDKLKLAQLLVKRDLRNIRDDNLKNLSEMTQSESVPEPKPNLQCKKIMKKPKPRERVLSIKRVPGPQTPNKVVLKKNLPIRSMSPPTRDTDKIWRPNKVNEIPIKIKDNEISNLKMKVDHCTNKLESLERHLLTQARSTQSRTPAPQFSNPSHVCKSNSELKILSEKLQHLISSKIQPPTNIDQFIPGTNSTQQEQPFDLILSKLNHLLMDMNDIQSRWSHVDYENVSVVSSVNRNLLDEQIRFTKGQTSKWHDPDVTIDDIKLGLDLPNEMIVRLDQSRLSNRDIYRLFGLPVKMVQIDWISSDLVDELVDEIVDDINDANNQLVDSILNSELED